MSPILLLIIGLIVVIGGILVAKLHPILALLLGAMIVGILTPPVLLQEYAQSRNLSPDQESVLLNQTLGARIAVAFGNTCEKIGLLIVLASIIGKCMLDSGAAERIVRTILGIFGERKAPVSFMASSFLLGIPIFFDTIFYLMIPLARAMGVRNEKSYALYVMAIVAGGTMAHSLVPPTPGPLYAAGAFGVSIGMMIMMGMLVGVACATGGLLYGIWLNKRQDIPLRATAETSVEVLKGWQDKPKDLLPSFFMSNLPIALPVALIAGNTIIKSLSLPLPENIRAFFVLAGNPVIALFLATVISLLLLSRQLGYRLKALRKPVEDAIYSAGTIILITATGGAFGAMLQQTAIGNWFIDLSPNYKLAALPLAFFVAAVIRTAQGSATVSIITTVGMLTAFAVPGVLSFHPVYLAIVIGCGSKLFPWMNDSGFWIICKMSGFTEGETIRNFSFLLCVMGMVGLVTTMILARLFPLL
jgi:GntP family gluconate:H+ symporter